MKGKNFGIVRATIYLIIANICMLILLFGLFFDVLECSFWGFLGCTIFGFAGLFAIPDDSIEDNYHSSHYDCYGDDDD